MHRDPVQLFAFVDHSLNLSQRFCRNVGLQLSPENTVHKEQYELERLGDDAFVLFLVVVPVMLYTISALLNSFNNRSRLLRQTKSQILKARKCVLDTDSL